MPSVCTVVDRFSVHHRPQLQDFSILEVKRRTWVRSSWDSHAEWASLHLRHIPAGETQAYQIILVRYQRTMILRPSHRRNRFSLNPNRKVNICFAKRLRRNASCCRCNKIPPRMECITAPQMDRCQIIITITIQQITTTLRLRDHRQSEVQTELMSVTSRIKILSASFAETRVQANIMDSLRAKVSVISTVYTLVITDQLMKNPFNLINLRSPLPFVGSTYDSLQCEVHFNNFILYVCDIKPFGQNVRNHQLIFKTWFQRTFFH